jgi:hypothetical protein
MKITFFKKGKNLSKLRSKLIKEIGYDHGYSILRSSESIKEHEYMFNLSKEYDNYGYMSQELGEELDSLFLNNNYIVGIHRTGYTYMDDITINKIFNEGLINNGHIMSGGIAGTQDIEKTVSLFYDFPILNGQLKAAHGYKGSEGCIVVKIPKSYLGKEDGEIKPIYYKKDSTVRLLPEFIYGYIPTKESGILGEIIRNPNYRDVHNLDNVNLLYEDSAVIRARKNGIELKQQEVSLDVKYQILAKAYKETYQKHGKRQAEFALLELINKNDIQYFSGQTNRSNLMKYVCYGDVLKTMCFGINIDSKDLNSIITSFCNQMNVIDTNEKII